MIRRIFFRAILPLVLIVSAILAWLVWDIYRVMHRPMPLPGEGVIYELRRGSTVALLAEDLKGQGFLRNAWYLPLWARWDGTAHKLQAGEYMLTQGLTPAALLQLMKAGQVTQYSLSLIEGWNFRQVMDAVSRSPYLTQTLQGLDDQQIMERLGYPGQHPEGRFFPDTYFFPKGLSDEAFLKRAYDALHARLEKAWSERHENLPLENSYQALTLASIVEKESAVPAERPVIAGVFVNRLRKNMRLQSDPTVIYGLGESYDGDIRYRDLRTDTPYNTYTRKGLPPTPIAIVGEGALKAATQPEKTDYIFFVAVGDGTGNHQFSKTLAEHERAVDRYLKRTRK